MSLSKTLSKTQTGQSNIFKNNLTAKQLESDVLRASINLRDLLNLKYKNSRIKFELSTKLPMIEVKEKLYLHNPLFGTAQLSNKASRIQPDGGLLWMIYDNVKYLVGVMEAKKQGTNNDRKQNGLIKQALGNAIERCYKNERVIQDYMSDQKIMPYLIMCHGCDFAEGSSIRDRLYNIVNGRDFNKIYLHETGGKKSSSVYIKESIWTYDEIYNIFQNMVNQSIDYYIHKYEIVLYYNH